MKKVIIIFLNCFKYVLIYTVIIIFFFNIGEFFSSYYEYIKWKKEKTKYTLFYKVPYLGHRLLPNFERDYERGMVKINSFGYRGREISVNKPKGVFRIICIGESSTFGLGCSNNDYTYPALLEKNLNSAINKPDLRVEVINAGIPSYTSFQCYMLLGLELLTLQPDLIIIYTGWNEMGEALCSTWNIDYRYGFMHQPFKEPEKSYLQYIEFFDGSYFIHRLQRTAFKIRRALAKNLHIRFEAEQRLPNYTKSAEFNTFALAIWKRNIINMTVLARNHNADVLFFTWPQFFYSARQEDILKSRFIMKGTDFKEKWMQAYKVYQQELGKIARDLNVYFFDAASLYLNQDNLLLFWDEIHLTDKGNKILADGLARFIVEKIRIEQ